MRTGSREPRERAPDQRSAELQQPRGTTCYVLLSKYVARNPRDVEASKRRPWEAPYDHNEGSREEQDSMLVGLCPRTLNKLPEPGCKLQSQAKPAPGMPPRAKNWCEPAITAELISEPLPRVFCPTHILSGQVLLDWDRVQESSCSAHVLSLPVGTTDAFHPIPDSQRYIGYDVADAAHSLTESLSRIVCEIADRLDSGLPLSTSQLFKLVGVLTTCAHYAVTFSQTLVRDCYLPGFLYDPKYVRTDRIRAEQRIFPHALNSVSLENDLPE